MILWLSRRKLWPCHFEYLHTIMHSNKTYQYRITIFVQTIKTNHNNHSVHVECLLVNSFLVHFWPFWWNNIPLVAVLSFLVVSWCTLFQVTLRKFHFFRYKLKHFSFCLVSTNCYSEWNSRKRRIGRNKQEWIWIRCRWWTKSNWLFNLLRHYFPPFLHFSR